MKKFLTNFFIASTLLLFGFNAQAETKLKFTGAITSVISSDPSISTQEGNFKGTMTFDELNLLSSESAISELSFDENSESLTGLIFVTEDFVNSNLTEIWINNHKLTSENLASINPALIALFPTANFRLVFADDSSEATVSGKLSSISVVSEISISPPDAPGTTISSREEVQESSPICELGADPQVINAGEGSALWWWSDAVATATIDNNIGAPTTSENYIWLNPAQTTTYTMNAVGLNGETTVCSTTIIVE